MSPLKQAVAFSALLVAVSGMVFRTAAAEETVTTMVSAREDSSTGDVTLENDGLRVTFRKGKPRFGLFPLGYTHYEVEVRQGDVWTRAGEVPYFTSYCYRSEWGRDWLHYVVPQSVELTNEGGCGRALFRASQTDLDRVVWHFEFSFELRASSPLLHVIYSAVAESPRDVLLFQGPRFHVGEGSFGVAKDEALFPGLEYLQDDERSSALEALAPDAQMNFAPHPAKITIPLMTVVRHGVAAGLMWDPRQKYCGAHEGPAAVFASPNWLENQDNHLLTLYLPGIPEYAAENGLRAHTPMTMEAQQPLTLELDLFAMEASHATQAVELWIKHRGGLPDDVALPRSIESYAKELVRILVDETWDPGTPGWPWEYGGRPSAHMAVATALVKALPFLDDDALARRARERVEGIAKTSAYLPLAIREGDMTRALEVQFQQAQTLMASQSEDGSWGYKPTDMAEGGLAGLMGPPSPGYIAKEGARSQGITAAKAADVLAYALMTGDCQAMDQGLRGVDDMNRYTVPYVYENHECPPSPSLHGAYCGVRACLLAYQLTGERAYLEKASYWARTGLPFVYLWSYGTRPVRRGQIHTTEKIFVEGERLYRDPVRDPMLYGALYGYGSSQYMHHWYGLLVHWIGLKYAEDVVALAPYEPAFDWPRLARGLVTSGIWQTFDVAPFAGYFPDAFSVERWVPSGPAFSPAALLDTILRVQWGVADTETVIVEGDGQRFHVTGSRKAMKASYADGSLRFEVDDEACRTLQVVISGVPEGTPVRVDGAEAPYQGAMGLPSYTRTPQDLTLLRLERTGAPRRIEVGPMK